MPAVKCCIKYEHRWWIKKQKRVRYIKDQLSEGRVGEVAPSCTQARMKYDNKIHMLPSGSHYCHPRQQCDSAGFTGMLSKSLHVHASRLTFRIFTAEKKSCCGTDLTPAGIPPLPHGWVALWVTMVSKRRVSLCCMDLQPSAPTFFFLNPAVLKKFNSFNCDKKEVFWEYYSENNYFILIWADVLLCGIQCYHCRTFCEAILRSSHPWGVHCINWWEFLTYSCARALRDAVRTILG